jgi:hypothetical protein
MSDPHECTGVFDSTAGKWLRRVARAPRSGEYMVDEAGEHHFAPEDDCHVVIIDPEAVIPISWPLG